MNNTKLFLAFVTGAAVGSVVAWKMLEEKYKKIADEEIESVREIYNKKMQKKVGKPEEQPVEEKKVIKEEPSYKNEAYERIVRGAGYLRESGKEEERDMVDNAKVYVIPPESFGETDYETVSLTYYADKVLADDARHEVITNIDEIVGHNSLETFGEYEDDSVFVRNDNLKKDFEILLDMRNYADANSIKPHLVDDDDED